MGNPNHDKLGRFTTGHGLAAGLGAAHAAKAGGGLNITASAPPKDKPVILVYGGAFNPPHEGHANGALVPAQEALTASGYKVDRVIVAPTADKLLASKQMALTDRLDLESRGRLAEVSFPKDIHGTKVDVRLEPSQQVEQATGKPRRTDLANWAQQQYPNHTIINVTGEDAVVPGAPDHHPSLYSGEVGSNHAGYNYLTLPRPEGSFSSSAVRAAVAAGTAIPGLTPVMEQAYRNELAKRKAKLVSQAFDFGHKPHK